MPGLEQSIRLPEVALRDLRRITLRSEVLGGLIEAFPDIASAPDVAVASRAMLEKTKLDPMDLADLLQGIDSILAFRETQGVGAAEAYNLLTQGIQTSASNDWKTENLGRWQAAALPLVQLLEPDNPLAIMSKANQLLYSHERVLASADIISDVRPTFDSSGTKVLRAVVTHTLSLRFRGLRNEEQFTVALDGTDLDLLEQVVRRAKQKAAAIRDQLTCWPVNINPRTDV